MATNQMKKGFPTAIRFTICNCKTHSISSYSKWLIENKAQLKYRITKIANYKKETKFTKIIGNVFTFILVLAVMLQVPVFAVFGYDFGLTYSPNQSMKIMEQDYSSLFNDNSGCAVIYDLQADVFNVYNKSDITKRVAPCSTYKIYSAINALEQGYITPENNTIKWDCLSVPFLHGIATKP